MNKYISLKDFLAKQITGDWGKEVSNNRYNTKVYCIRGADINAINGGEYNNLPVRYIEKKNKSKFLKEGHIVIEISGGSPIQSTGRISYVRSIYTNIICSNFCRAFEIKKEHSPKYFYYLVKNIYNSNIFFNFESKTTGIKNLLFDIAFESIKVPNISLASQLTIAKTLSDLDSKIELNNQINQDLEAMAKTLYDYWFVQFDFPNEEGKPYKTSGGKMVYREELKREVPEGWEVKTISEWIAKDKSGDWGKESKQGNYTEKVSCIRGADINGLNGNGEVNAPERFILEKNNHKLLEHGDLIIEISGGSPTQSTGRMAFIIQETLERFEDPLICSNFCKAVTLKDEAYLFNFVYQWNRLYDAGVLFGWEGKTSGIKNFLFESFVTNHSVVFPKKKIVEKFYDILKPIHIQKQKNLKQNQHLAELRDWLLPMLMNGQVKVKDAAEVIERQMDEGLRVVAEGKEEYKTD